MSRFMTAFTLRIHVPYETRPNRLEEICDWVFEQHTKFGKHMTFAREHGHPFDKAKVRFYCKDVETYKQAQENLTFAILSVADSEYDILEDSVCKRNFGE